MKQRRFGGQDAGDDSSAILDHNRKALSQVIEDDTFREFDFRQYIFARQAHVSVKDAQTWFGFCFYIYNNYSITWFGYWTF